MVRLEDGNSIAKILQNKTELESQPTIYKRKEQVKGDIIRLIELSKIVEVI